MSGFALSQVHSKGDLFQQTVYPGQWPGFPPVPAAGSYTCNPQNMDKWRLVACTFTMVTDDNDQNRNIEIQYPTGTMGLVAFDVTGISQAASLTTNYCGYIGAVFNSDSQTPNNVNFQLSGLFRDAGQGLTIAILNAGAADALSAIALTFDRTVVADDSSQAEYATVLEQKVL